MIILNKSVGSSRGRLRCWR